MDLIATFMPKRGQPRVTHLDLPALHQGFHEHGFSDEQRSRALANLEAGLPVFVGAAVIRKLRPMRRVARLAPVDPLRDLRPVS